MYEAAQTLRLLPDPELRYLVGLRSTFPEIYRTADEVFAVEVEQRKSNMFEDNVATQLTATKDAIARLDIVIGWMVLFSDRSAPRLVWAKVSGFSQKRIAKIAKCSRFNAQQKYGKALTQLTMALNGVRHSCDGF